MLKETDQIQLEMQPPVLAVNFESLKAWAVGLTSRYVDLVVTEDDIADAKRDMVEINKNKAKLEDARKDAVRRVSEPIRAFETRIKEVCGIFDTAYAKLGSQVKAFEDAQREEKRKVVEDLISNANRSAFGEPDYLDIPVQEKWLNKTTSIKAIREDLAAIINRHMEEEERRKVLEQARQDRVAAIESHVHALNAKYDLALPVHRFMNGRNMDLTPPVDAVFAGIRAVFEAEAENAKAEGSPHTTQPLTTIAAPATAPAPPAAPCKTRAMSIRFEYDVANEQQVKACLATLKVIHVASS